MPPTDGGNGPDHYFVEHFGRGAERLIVGQRHQALVEPRVGVSEGFRVFEGRPRRVNQTRNPGATSDWK